MRKGNGASVGLVVLLVLGSSTCFKFKGIFTIFTVIEFFDVSENFLEREAAMSLAEPGTLAGTTNTAGFWPLLLERRPLLDLLLLLFPASEEANEINDELGHTVDFFSERANLDPKDNSIN